MTKDMTKGKPLSLIIGFCLPMIFGSLFQQLYNMVDSIIVGQYVGVKAFAGVGSIGSVCFLVIGTAIGMCSGFAIPIAQSFGAENYKLMRKTIYNANLLAAGVAVVLTVVTTVFCKPLLNIMNTTPDTYEYAYTYIRVIFLGIPITILYNMLASLLRALGDSKTPLKYLLIASFLNIGFDLLFIIVFKAGVLGAALATVLSQLISGLICLRYVKKMPILGYNEGEKVRDAALMKRVFSLGMPMAFQFSITAVGTIILQASVNSLGSNIVAATSAATKIQNIIAQPMETLGVTMATFGGQNLGAGKTERVRKSVKQALGVLLLYTLFITIAIYFFGENIAHIFISKKEEDFTIILENVRHFLRVSCMFYTPLGLVFFFRNLLQGLGFSAVTMLAGLIELVCRTFVAFMFVYKIGFDAVCFASPVAWTAAAVLLVILYIVEIQRAEHKLPKDCCKCAKANI